jgi:hypothetical protein
MPLTASTTGLGTGSRKPLDAGPFAPEIGSFRLHLAAEGKAPKTVRTYTEAVQWFAAAHLIPRAAHTRWDQVQAHDVRRWMVWPLGLYSDAYASNQYRALQQFPPLRERHHRCIEYRSARSGWPSAPRCGGPPRRAAARDDPAAEGPSALRWRCGQG